MFYGDERYFGMKGIQKDVFSSWFCERLIDWYFHIEPEQCFWLAIIFAINYSMIQELYQLDQFYLFNNLWNTDKLNKINAGNKTFSIVSLVDDNRVPDKMQ